MVDFRKTFHGMTAPNDGSEVSGSREDGGMGHRGGQEKRTRASHHPKQQHCRDVFRIEHPPNDHRAEEHNRNPDRGELLHKTLQARWLLAEGVNGFDEAGEAGIIARRRHFDLHRTALKHEASVEFVPVSTSTGTDSPVKGAMSRLPVPATMRPSAGMSSPERICNLSPARNRRWGPPPLFDRGGGACIGDIVVERG